MNHVRNTYEVLLRRFSSPTFKPKPKLRSVEELMTKAVDAFRTGTLTEESKATVE